MMEVQPVTLEGQVVRLEPLRVEHLPDLLEAAQDDEIWRYVPMSRPYTLADMQEWYEVAMEGQRAGTLLPFAIIDRANNKAIGTTRYMAISKLDYGVEIGHTWLGRAYWRSAVNTECKYLLMRHAFETLHCIRVWLKTDSRNVRSQEAILRIGAKKEVVIRNHMIMRDGYRRQIVVFSVIDEEWPEVKANLEQRMGLVVGQ